MGDMVIKNAPLLFKWWWRFSEENNSLWKRVICSCNNLVMNRQIGDQLNSRATRPWKAICNVWKLNKELEQVCTNRIRVEVGNGEATLMWEDLWIGDMTVKCKFPRLKIKDCGL